MTHEERKAMDWIYENNKDNTCRFVLGIAGKNPLICIGANPSTAEPDKLDNTLKSVARISEANGFDSWIMINICPQRATNSDDMDFLRDYKLESANLIQIENIMIGKKPAIWAAWGALITKRPYLLNSLYEIIDLSKDYN